MEVKDITEILKGREHKAINSQDTINVLNYLKDKGVEEIPSRYILPPHLKYPAWGYLLPFNFKYLILGRVNPVEELISVIKNHIYDGTGTIQSYEKPIEGSTRAIITVIKNYMSDGTRIIECYEDKISKYKINLEGSLKRVYVGIYNFRQKEKMEIIIGKN